MEATQSFSQLTETAQVVDIKDNYAWVEVVRKSSCGGCQSTKSCGTQVLAEIFPVNTLVLKVENTINAKIGDTVLLTLSSAHVLSSSLISYTFPLLTMFMSLLLHPLFCQDAACPAADIVAIILSIIGLSIGFIGVIIFNNFLKQKKSYQPQIKPHVDIKPHAIK